MKVQEQRDFEKKVNISVDYDYFTVLDNEYCLLFSHS